MIAGKKLRILIYVVIGLNLIYFINYFRIPISYKIEKEIKIIKTIDDENSGEINSQKETIINTFNESPQNKKIVKDPFFENTKLKQNDPELIEYIRKYHLSSPSNKPYNLEDPKGNPSAFIPEIHKLFGSKRNGVFIECGANDGEYLSNTLALERDQGWSGILIEADHMLLSKLYGKNRNALISDACLSYKPYPQKVRFIHNTGTSYPWLKAIGIIEPSGRGNPETIQFKEQKKDYVYTGDSECFPLYSILLAADLTTIDYFTLDVEGLEFKILKTIPFDKIQFKVISVEFHLIPEGKDALLHFMKTKGFRQVLQSDREWFFINERFLHEFKNI